MDAAAIILSPERREGGREEGGQASLFVCFVPFL